MEDKVHPDAETGVVITPNDEIKEEKDSADETTLQSPTHMSRRSKVFCVTVTIAVAIIVVVAITLWVVLSNKGSDQSDAASISIATNDSVSTSSTDPGSVDFYASEEEETILTTPTSPANIFPLSIIFKTIERGSCSYYCDTANTVIRTQEEWNMLSSALSLHSEIDLISNMVVAVFKRRPTGGGFSIDITSVEEHEDKLVVNIFKSGPPPWVGTTDAVENPLYHIIKLDTSDKEVVFKEKYKKYTPPATIIANDDSMNCHNGTDTGCLIDVLENDSISFQNSDRSVDDVTVFIIREPEYGTIENEGHGMIRYHPPFGCYYCDCPDRFGYAVSSETHPWNIEDTAYVTVYLDDATCSEDC